MHSSVFHIVCVVVSVLLCVSAQSRENAFINYSELALPDDCKDKSESCRDQAAKSLCLLLPYDLRVQCPLSCRLRRCNIRTERQVHIDGYATPEGTAAYAQRFIGTSQTASNHFRMNYQTTNSSPEHALLLSSLGMGTYLGEADAKTDANVINALLYSVARGWNVIDTASNYRWGSAETSLGEALLTVLAGTFASGFPDRMISSPTQAVGGDKGGGVQQDVTRDMLFISTKAGFMDEAITKRLLAARAIYRRDVVSGHCMHPQCLQASLELSLNRLSLKTVDLLYLHNSAEMQLADKGKKAYMERLKTAFKTLEEMRTAGSIRTYGLATWECFRVPTSQKGHLELEAVVQLAEEVGGPQHGFKYIQLPVSAGMTEAWEKKWQMVEGVAMTLLEAAAKLHVGVFTSAPLMEAQLLDKLTPQLPSVEELRSADGSGAKLVQWARSTPGVLTTLVGHKSRQHVEENAHVAKLPPLEAGEHGTAYQQLQAALAVEATE